MRDDEAHASARDQLPIQRWAGLPPWAIVGGGCVLLATLILTVGALRARSEEEDARKDARAIEEATAHAVAMARAKDQEERQAAEAEARVVERNARYVASVKTWSPAQREQQIRNCILKEHCNQETLNAITDAAATPKEHKRLEAASRATQIAAVATGAHDGEAVDHTHVDPLAAMLAVTGASVLDDLPKTSVREALKDPDSARGATMRSSGRIVEIRKVGTDIFEGALMTSAGDVVRFVTPFPTPGIVRGTWTTFRGVFVQEFAYANVSGGQTRSLLLVGAFEKARDEEE